MSNVFEQLDAASPQESQPKVFQQFDAQSAPAGPNVFQQLDAASANPPTLGSMTKHAIGGTLEAGAALATSMVSMPVAGLAGLVATAAKAAGVEVDPVDIVNRVSGMMTYEPKSPTGQTVAGIVNWPFEKLGELGDYVGSAVLDATGSPAAAAAANAGVQVGLPSLIPGLRGKAAAAEDAGAVGAAADHAVPASPMLALPAPKPVPLLAAPREFIAAPDYIHEATPQEISDNDFQRRAAAEVQRYRTEDLGNTAGVLDAQAREANARIADIAGAPTIDAAIQAASAASEAIDLTQSVRTSTQFAQNGRALLDAMEKDQQQAAAWREKIQSENELELLRANQTEEAGPAEPAPTAAPVVTPNSSTPTPLQLAWANAVERKRQQIRLQVADEAAARIAAEEPPATAAESPQPSAVSAEVEAAYRQRAAADQAQRLADERAALDQRADQQVAQAMATSPEELQAAPTAMQLAFEAAREKKAVEAAPQPAPVAQAIEPRTPASPLLTVEQPTPAQLEVPVKVAPAPAAEAPAQPAPNPAVQQIHGLAAQKGMNVDTDEFKAWTKKITGKTHLDDLTPVQLGAVTKKLSALPDSPVSSGARAESVVERFQGKYGKGMGERNAREAMAQLQAQKPALAWAVEPSTAHPDRFDVVGRARGEVPVEADDIPSFARSNRFDLQSQSPEDLAAKAVQSEAAAKAATDNAAAREEAERQGREKQEIADRSKAAADDFKLGESGEDNLSGQKPLFSRKGDESTGISRDDFHSTVADAFGKSAADRLVDKVIIPLDDQSKLPAHVVPFVRDGDKIMGFHDPRTGKTYAVLSNLSKDDIRGLVLHEVGVHYGFKDLLGDRYDKAMQQLDALRRLGNPDVKAAFAEASKQASSDALIPEETLAYLIQNRPQLPFVQHIVAWIKAQVYRLTGLGRLNPDDFAALARAAVMRAGKTQEPILTSAPAFIRDQVNSGAFKKWFGGSKVVDAEGKPLVVYHGTKSDVAAFDKKHAGTSDPGLVGKAFYFTPSPEQSSDFAHNRHYGKGESPNVMPVYVSLQNPAEVIDGKLPDGRTLTEAHPNGITRQSANAVQAALRKAGFDGAIFKTSDGEITQVAAFRPEQIKSAIGNTGAYDATNSDIRFARANDRPEWVKNMAPDAQEALRKAGVWTPKQTLKERWDDIRQDAGQKILQGAVDQFAPVMKKIGDYPYKLLRMASSADAGLEASLEYGRLKLNDAGALETMKGTKGFLDVVKPLQGEADRFLAWVAGHRAEGLSAEDREHLFGTADIAELKKLNRMTNAEDNFADGSSGAERPKVYAQVLRDYNAFSKSILDIAEKSGIVDGAKRALWEKEFYVPFYRNAEEKQTGPANLSGMVNQYAFKKLKGGEEPLKDLLANTLQNWSHLLNASLKNNAAKVTLAEAERLGIAKQVPSDTRGSVYVLDNGKEVHYTVSDPLVLDAVSSLGASPFKGAIVQALGKMKNILTVGTTASPVFRLRHTIREQITAMAANPTSYNFVKNWIDGFKYSSRNNPEYGNMLAGGSFFRMGMGLQDQNAAYAKRLIAHGVDASTVLDTPAKVEQVLKGAWDWWKETGERSDSITRANIYRQIYADQVAKGATPDKAHFEAAYAARDVMDYGLHGAWAGIRMLTQVVPFMNARMQGLYKLGRGAAADPKRFAAVVGGVTLATIALSLAYRDDKDFQNLSEWARDNNWWFKIGDKAFLIPKPFELGAIGTVVDRALETALNGFDPASRERFVQRLWPIVGSQLNMNPIPQAIWPLVQLWANKDVFRGTSIETQSMQNLSTPNRFGPNTSATARLAGKAGILSPAQIDFLVNSYFGWVGSHVVATSDLALRPMMGLPAKASPRADDYFITGDFVKDLPSDQSRFVNQFYNHLRSTQEAFEDMRMAQHAGQAGAAAEATANPDVKFAPMYRQASAIMARLNKQAARIQGEDIDPGEKRAAIDRLEQTRNDIAQRVEDARSERLRSEN